MQKYKNAAFRDVPSNLVDENMNKISLPNTFPPNFHV